MLRLASDADVHGEIIRGVRRRLPEIDLIRVQDVGLLQSDDQSILMWAAENNRILFTHDRATMPHYAFARVNAKQPMHGVFIMDSRISFKQAIEELLLINDCSEQYEWSGLVVYLPL